MLVLLSFPLAGWSQIGGEIIDSLEKEDREAIYALVLYPEDVRVAILEVCKSPEIILSLGDIQQETQERFAALMETQTRDEQEDWYELVRYPDLIEIMAREKLSNRKMRELLREYPEDIQDIAFQTWDNNLEMIRKIDEINLLFSENVQNLLEPYPEPIPESVNRLIGLPEVLDILNEHFTISVRAGAMYRKNPEAVLRMADSLNLVAAQQNAEELEQWREELRNNPDAREELEAAAGEFYDDYEVDPPVYRSPDEEDERQVHIYHHVDPYPYWIGYPWWYRYPYWYPRPYWYHLGFYWRTDRTIVVFNLPSYYFVSWYFDIPRHHYYYPRFSHIYIRHFERHPRSYYASTTYVGTWVHQHRHVYDRVWLVDDGRRVERLREYGRLEDNYRRYVARRPDGSRVMDREAYLASRSTSYPTLERSRRPDGTVSRRLSTDYDPVYQRRTTGDRTSTRDRTPDRESREANRTGQRQPEQQDRVPQRRTTREKPDEPRQPTVRRPEPSREPTTSRPGESSRSSEYHRGKWVRPTQRSPQRPTVHRPTSGSRTRPVSREPANRKPSTQNPRRP